MNIANFINICTNVYTWYKCIYVYTVWKSNLLLLKPPQITKSNKKHCDHWEKLRTRVLSYLSRAFPDKVN